MKQDWKGQPHAPTMEPIDCVVTMATQECASEFALMHASLRTFHPDIPVIVGVSSEAAATIDGSHRRGVGASADTSSPEVAAALQYAAHTIAAEVGTGQTVLVPCLDQYGAVSRRRMERQPGVWYSTRHTDFMMEKANLLEHGLHRGAKRPLFVDSDMLFLGPLPAMPAAAQVGVSRHRIRPSDERLFGTFNGGWVAVAGPDPIYRWRAATRHSRYFDQASLEDVAAAFSGAAAGHGTYEFGTGVNYGYWRMFQATEHSLDVARRFAVSPGAIAVGPNEPLCSAHTHFFMPTDSRAIPVFNRVIASWTVAAKFGDQFPAWRASVHPMIARWCVRSALTGAAAP